MSEPTKEQLEEVKYALQSNGAVGEGIVRIVNLCKNRIASLEAEVAKYHLLKDAVNSDSGDCTAECDSYGHADDCTWFDAADVIERLKAKVAELGQHVCGECIDKQPEPDGEWKAVAIEAVIQEHKWADQAIALKHRVQKLNRNRIEEEKDLNRRLALQIEERDRYMEQRDRYKQCFEELVAKIKSGGWKYPERGWTQWIYESFIDALEKKARGEA